MIKSTLELLRADDWIGAGEAVEIAKGKYELPKSWKGVKTKIARKWRSKK